MKKIRHILLFIVAVAMMVSMSAMCFSVSAETKGVASTGGKEWKFNIRVGAPGSDATLTDGQFSLHQSGGVLDSAVSADGYITAYGIQKVFAKSKTGIIDMAPDKDTAARIVFTAPADGFYLFNVCLEKTDMPAFGDAKQVKNWTEIGATKAADGGYDGGWVYKAKGITNVSGYAGATANVTKFDYCDAVELKAGECITVQVKAEGDYSSNTTVKKFDVYQAAAGDTWKLDETFSIGKAGSEATIMDGPFSLLQKGGVLDSTVSADGYITANGGTQKVFAKSKTGIIDMAPANGTAARIVFTAPADGLYLFDVSLEKTDMPAFGNANQVKNWTEVGKTETAEGGFNGAWVYKNKGITNVSDYAGATANVTKFDASALVELKAGECITLSMGAEAAYSSNTTVNKFNVDFVGTSYENLDTTIQGEISDLTTLKKVSDTTGFSLGAMVKRGDEYVMVDLEAAAKSSWAAAYPGWWTVENADMESQYVFLRSDTGLINMRPTYPDYSDDYYAVIKYTAKETGNYTIIGNFTKSVYDGKVTEADDPNDVTDVISVQMTAGEIIDFVTMSEASTTAKLNTTVYLKAGETVMIVADNNYGWTGGAETTVNSLVVAKAAHVCDDFDNGKCTDCGKACDHAAAEAQRTCKAGATCELCGKKLSKKASAHATPNTFTYKPNADGKTHAKHYACCDAVAVASENHSFDATGKCTVGDCAYQCPHTAAEALRNCKDTPVCEICQVTLETLPGKHKLDTFTYEANADNATHAKKYECCGEVVTATEVHDWSNKDGECAKCKAECGHEDATVANCQIGSTCNICKKVLSDKDENNHVNPEASKLPNADGETHTEKWICCGKVVADDQAHVFGDDIVCDDCGYGCDHETWNAEYKCEACGYACPHVESTDATCVAEAICKECGKKTADKDADNHTTTETNFVDNENGTHTEKHNCCGAEIATNNHDWTNKDGKCVKCVATCDHKDAPAADCKDASVCPTCGKTVADKDASKHVGTIVAVDNKNGTHTEKYECCGTVVNATANHSYTNGKCACGAKKASSPQTSDTAMSVAVALVAIAGVGIFALNSKKRRQK